MKTKPMRMYGGFDRYEGAIIVDSYTMSESFNKLQQKIDELLDEK